MSVGVSLSGCFRTALLLLSFAPLIAACAGAQVDPASKLTTGLLTLANCAEQGVHAKNCEAAPLTLMRFDNMARVQVDVSFPCSDKPPLETVKRAGLLVTTTVNTVPYCVIEGWINPKDLKPLAAIKNVTFVSLPHYAHFGTGN